MYKAHISSFLISRANPSRSTFHFLTCTSHPGSTSITSLHLCKMLINITLSLAGLIIFIAAQDVPLSWIDVNPPPEDDVFLQIDGSVTSVSPSLLYNTGLPQG